MVDRDQNSSVLLDDKTIEEALAVCYRAVSACQFYPQQHPTLLGALDEGYQAWRRIEEDYRWEQPGLQLRKGQLWLGDSALGPGNPAITGLARVFTHHGLVGLRKQGPLSRDGFAQLATYLATTPEVIQSRGGLTSLWQRSLYAGALQLSTLHLAAGNNGDRAPGPRSERSTDWGAGLPDNEADPARTDSLLASRLQALQKKSPRERAIVDLLMRLGQTEDIATFLDLLRQIARFVEEHLDRERYREAFYIVLYLYREAQNMDSLGREGKRDYLLDTVRMLVRGEFQQWLIQQVCTARGDEEAETGEFILRALGKGAVVAVINTLCVEKTRIGRRRLVNVLVGIGDPTVPWAVKMLEDQRWFVVRNMVTVLGGIGSPEAMKALLRLTGDADARIRREIAHALGRSPSPEAERQLLGLLEDRDPAVRQMAISSASAHRSETVLAALWRIFDRTRIGGTDWETRVAVLQSVGRLGMPEAASRLAAVIRRKHFFRRDRWLRVRSAAVDALGRTGDAGAAALLNELKTHAEPDLRTAATRALRVLEQRVEESGR